MRIERTLATVLVLASMIAPAAATTPEPPASLPTSTVVTDRQFLSIPSNQSCVNGLDPQTLAPLTTAGNYTGNFSGAYPRQLYNSSNSMPAGHRTAGDGIGRAIVPLNASGGNDPANGVTIIVGIGDENARLEIANFTQTYVNGGQTNASVRVVNGALDNYSASRMTLSGTDYWTKLAAQVNSSGYTLAQPQVALIKITNDEPQSANGTPQMPNPDFATSSDKEFPRHANRSTMHLRDVVTRAKALFPNLKQAYVMSREYQGWSCAASGTQFREPVGFEEGFPVKWTVTAQIDGDPALTYSGPGARAPWLSWGPYLWNSTAPQNHYTADGSTPSNLGSQTIAGSLFQMLDADTTSRPWFHRPTGGGNAPTVSRTNPLNQSLGVSVATGVAAIFSRAMNRTTTAAAFSIAPAAAGNITWQFGDRALTFRPAAWLQLATNYSVGIAASATAADAVPLGTPYSFWFVTNSSPPPPPTVLRSSPSDAATNVPVNARISIYFSRSMLPPTVEAVTNIVPNITSTPTWRQQSTNYTLTPSQPLSFQTTYTVTIGTGAMSQDGVNLQAPFYFSFTTGSPPPVPPRVLGHEPTNGATGVSRDAKIVISFDAPMNQASVEGATSSNPSVIWTPSWNSSGNGATFTPNALLPASTTFTVTVSTAATGLSGAPMAAALTFTFSTGTTGGATPPTVVSTDPANGAKDVEVSVAVKIVFSKPMDLAATENAITFAPAVTVTFAWNSANDTATLTSSTELKFSTAYALKIATAAKSADGAALASGFTATFTTKADPSAGGGGGGTSSNTGLLIGAGVAVAVAVGLLLFLLMRRKKKALVPGSDVSSTPARPADQGYLPYQPSPDQQQAAAEHAARRGR